MKRIIFSLFLILAIVVSMGVKADNEPCEAEVQALTTAEANLATVTWLFNTNADSCLYYYTEQALEAFPGFIDKLQQYLEVQPGNERIDSINAWVKASDWAISGLGEDTPECFIGMNRTGKNAQGNYAEIPAQTLAVAEAAAALEACLESQSGIVIPQAIKKSVAGYYSLSGQKLPKEPASGIYIVVYEDGSREKVRR
jgi:hypothetical protein